MDLAGNETSMVFGVGLEPEEVTVHLGLRLCFPTWKRSCQVLKLTTGLNFESHGFLLLVLEVPLIMHSTECLVPKAFCQRFIDIHRQCNRNCAPSCHFAPPVVLIQAPQKETRLWWFVTCIVGSLLLKLLLHYYCNVHGSWGCSVDGPPFHASTSI